MIFGEITTQGLGSSSVGLFVCSEAVGIGHALWIWSHIRHHIMSFYTELQIMHLETRLVVARWEGEGAGWTGNLGITDADSCLWDGEAMSPAV